MDEQLVGTLTYENYKADIYSTAAPGEFKVVYLDGNGNHVEEVPLTGISSYHQRESEIVDRLRQLRESGANAPPADLGDPGEY